MSVPIILKIAQSDIDPLVAAIDRLKEQLG